MENDIKKAIKLIEEHGIFGYDLVDPSIKNNIEIVRVAKEHFDLKGRNFNKWAYFSTLKRLEAIILFDDIYNKHSTQEKYENIYQGFVDLFDTLKAKEKSQIKEMCIELSEFPDRYSNFSSDLKYYPAVTRYVSYLISKYENFLNNAKFLNNGGYRNFHREDFTTDIYRINTDAIDKYLKIYADIIDEMHWAHIQYSSRNIQLDIESKRKK